MPKHKPIKFEALDQGFVKQINKISGNENHYLGLRKKSGVRIETLRQEVSNIYIIHAKHILSILPFPHSVF